MSTKEQLLRLSVSKTKTFIDCKAKYNFAYNLKLPKKEFEFHTFGKLCHKILEDFHNAYISGAQEPFNITMKAAYKAAIEEYKDKIKPEMKTEVWNIFNRYLEIISNDKKNKVAATVLACEKPFELVVDNKIVLNGMIDRIQIDQDGVLHIADYKTTKDKKYLKNDYFQLLTYAYVMLSEDPSLELIRCSYIMLRHDFEYITTEFKKDEIVKVESKYIDYFNQIINESEFKASPTNLCRYCDFLDSCKDGKNQYNSYAYGEVDWV